ncbi:MAG TPA: hypothetical protein DCQ06_14470 [Myxococcales bacterium]|nr:hypothetical protein [Myxococcales bacterium]HAN32795.1 hypothetical protein [Myxococcales bacterium]
MRIRHRALLVLCLLLIAVSTAWVMVGRDILLRITALPVETTEAAVDVLALAAAALCALAIAAGVVALRLWVIGPIESLAKQHQSKGGNELVALRTVLEDLQTQLDRARSREKDSLGAVQTLLEREDLALVRQDRQVLTGQLALGVAHELGSPLTVAMGCVDSLDEQVPDALSQPLQQSLERMIGVLQEFNDFGLQGHSNQAMGLCDVAIAAGETIHLARLHPKCSAIPVEFIGLPEAQSSFARIATSHLNQILLNLLINAADALQSTDGLIEVRLGRDDSHVCVWVDDNGPGIEPALRETIFEAYVTAKPSAQGSGLGLSICRRLARSAGGDLIVINSPLGGARFELRLIAAEG